MSVKKFSVKKVLKNCVKILVLKIQKTFVKNFNVKNISVKNYPPKLS